MRGRIRSPCQRQASIHEGKEFDVTTTTYDPTTTATSLAQAYTSGAQKLLTTQTTKATNTAAALTKLRSALTAFDSAVNSLSGSKGVLAQSATFSDAGVGTASASGNAAAGNYSFFVQQLASAGQTVYANLSAIPVSQGGRLGISLAGGASFDVDLGAADSNNDGTLSPAEIATAINKAAGNDSLVTASLVTVGGQSQLVITSTATGAAGAVTLDTRGLAAGALKASLDSGTQLVAAQDAIVWLGAQGTGIALQQASNTFDAVAGVTVTFNKVMTAGQAPVSLTVATDANGTAANLQSFVNAYNTLKTALDGLTSTGNASAGVAASIFADDSAVRTLRSRIESTIRMSVGGLTLANYGVTASQDGTLSLDQTRMKAKLASNPAGLETLLGSAGITTSSGVLGALDTYLNQWTNITTGQIKQRQDAVTQLQTTLTARQKKIDDQYNNAYKRYLAQFTALQSLQEHMSHTTDLFDALFNSNSNR